MTPRLTTTASQKKSEREEDENDTTEESEAEEEVILVPMEENVDLSHTSPPPSPSPLPEGWAEAPNGSYRNSYTGKTQWTRP